MSVDPRYAARFQRGFDPSEHGAGDAAGAPAAGEGRSDAAPASAADAGGAAAAPVANPFTREGAAQLGATASPYARSAAAASAAVPAALPPSTPAPVPAPALAPAPAPSDASASPYARSATGSGGYAIPAPSTESGPSVPSASWSPATTPPDFAPRDSRATVPVRLGPNGERIMPSARAGDDDPAARYAEVADELTDDELRELGLLARRRINPWIIVLAVISIVALVVAVALSMSTYEMQADGYGFGFDSDREAAGQAWLFFLQQAGQTLAQPLYFVGILGSTATIALLFSLRRRR